MIRKAVPEDAEKCSELTFMAGKAEFRYFFPIDDSEILRLLQVFFRRKNNIFSRNNMWVEETDGTVRGVMLMIPGSQKKKMEQDITRSILEIMKISGIPALLKIIYRLTCSRLFPQINDDELYIDTIAVYPEHRRKKVASSLIEKATSTAAAVHLPKLSLIVKIDNRIGLEVYRKNGFVKMDSIKLHEKYHKFDLYGFFKMAKK